MLLSADLKYRPMYELPLPLFHQGKTRETYELPGGPINRWPHLLIVASDRISTHNIVHHSTVPRKGEILTALTIFWLKDVLEPEIIKQQVSHHLVAYGQKIYDHLPGRKADYPPDLPFRAIVVRKLKIAPVEFIYRRYLTGSLWNDYYSKGLPNPYGCNLRPDLPKMAEFPAPIFTPTEKSDTDKPLNEKMTLRDYNRESMSSYWAFLVALRYLETRPVTLIDSKIEVGTDREGNYYIADEFATPDSSRFALTSEIKEKKGEDPSWYDKQLAREEAERRWAARETKGPLVFSPLTISKLVDRYHELFKLVVGTDLATFQIERLA